MGRLALLLSALAAAPASGSGSGAAAGVVDRVVARVDDAVITQSALTAETRLVLLDARTPQLAIDAELTRPLLGAVLRTMVHRALLVNEMKRLQLRPAAADEVRSDLERLARRFESRADFRAFLVDIGLVDPGAPDLPGFDAPRAIVERLRVEREVQRFVDVRVRPSLVTSDRELRACYEANLDHFGALRFEDARPRIQVRLREQKRTRALEALLDQLEKRAVVRIEAPYDVPAPPEVDEELGFSCPERVR